MFAPLTLILSVLVVALAFMSVRRLEAARGIRFFEPQRRAFDVYAESVWAALVLGGIPVSWRTYVRAVIHDITHMLVRLMVEVIRAVERPLARLSYKMRVSAPKGTGAPVSEFLKILSPEKK
ncbi:MAG: hypothetical protein NBV63_00210 [Candidatus Pacebacteria bacterium]|nr:hypothetical protein [Candidatus Paceibacterota bacterium]